MLIKKHQQAFHAQKLSFWWPQAGDKTPACRVHFLHSRRVVYTHARISFRSANTKFTYSLLSAGKLPWNDWSLFLHQSVHSASESFGIWLAPFYS